MTLNVSTPFPWWENMDDHHTTLRQTHNGDLVITGIIDTSGQPRPLIGGVVVMGTDGTVRSRHVINQTYGEYVKQRCIRVHVVLRFCVIILSML